jgi:PAS domain S-box-containing protein
VNREALLAQIADSTLGTFGQACLVGVLLNLVAAAGILYLWSEDRSERYLRYLGLGHLCIGVRWALTYPAIALPSTSLQAAAAVFGGLSIILNVVGALSLLQVRPAVFRSAVAGLALLLAAMITAGLLLAKLSFFFALATPAAWAAAAVMFEIAHRRRPLGAYRLATLAMAFNSAVWCVGFAIAGRAFVASIVLPLTALPAMLALFAIAHQRAMAKVRDSEETVSTLLDTIPMPVVISLPPDGKVERINRAAVEIFGGAAADYIGRNGVQSGVIGDQPARLRVHEDLLAGREVRNRDMVYVRGDGAPMQVSLNASRVELRDGPRYVFTLFDLTDFRRVESALQELNASLEQQVADRTRDLESFNYSVSHDLRAPLRAIDGYSALLLDEFGDSLSAPAREYAERIRGNCRRMGELIDAMILLARRAAAALQPTLVDLSALSARIIDELNMAEPRRRVEVRIEPWLRVVADRDAASIVMDNLLRNAWKYSARVSAARIEVGAELQEGQRIYYVRDNGAGFDMADAGELFKPFTRLHSEAEFEGTGIGLATVSRLLHNHGGRIWAQSRPGQGTTFYFHFGHRALADEPASAGAA